MMLPLANLAFLYSRRAEPLCGDDIGSQILPLSRPTIGIEPHPMANLVTVEPVNASWHRQCFGEVVRFLRHENSQYYKPGSVIKMHRSCQKNREAADSLTGR